MKKWVVVNAVINGDDFSIVCRNKEEALNKAEDIFCHLTDEEKKNQTLCVAEMDIDEDGCPDWMVGYTPAKEWL